MVRTFRTVARGEPEADELDLARVQVSHLCHTAECFNPRHVVIEYPADNYARNLCLSAVVVLLTMQQMRNHVSLEFRNRQRDLPLTFGVRTGLPRK